MHLMPQSNLRRSDLVRLLAGDAHQRCWAARIAEGPTGDEQSADIGALLVLVNDQRPNVRATAAAGLVTLVMAGCQDPAVADAVDFSATAGS
jgi:hypothetical protein